MAFPTTYRTFIDGLNAITVTGVSRTYTEPPTGAPSVADCPCKFLIFPGGSERALVFGVQGGRRDLRVELWIGIGPVAQNLGEVNWDAGVDMMDNLSTALQGSDCIGAAHFEWDISLVEKQIAGTAYWTVVAVIRGSG